MATTRLTDPMITALMESLRHRRTDDGRYEVFAPVRTRNALVARGKVVHTQEYRDNNGTPVTRWYLTADGIGYLSEALTFVLAERGEERDAVWTEWLNGDRRNRSAALDFLGFTADSYEVTTTTPYEGGAHRETLSRADAHEQMGSVMTNGQRITLDGGTLTVHTKLRSSWTFKPLGLAEEAPATASMAGMPSSTAQQATDAAITADYRAEAARLLGPGERWVKHTTVSGIDHDHDPVDREGALNMIVLALRGAGVWSISRTVTGGLQMVSPDGDTVFWLQPVAEEQHDRPTAQTKREARALAVKGLYRALTVAGLPAVTGPDHVVTTTQGDTWTAVYRNDGTAQDGQVWDVFGSLQDPGPGMAHRQIADRLLSTAGVVALLAPVSDPLLTLVAEAAGVEEQAAALLGEGARFLRHWRNGDDSASIPADRAEVLPLIITALREDWTTGRRDGAATLAAPDGDTYVIEPLTEAEEQHDRPADEEAPAVAIDLTTRAPRAKYVTVGELNVGDEFVTRCGWTVKAIDGGTFTADRYDGGQTVTQTVPVDTKVLRTRRAQG